MTFEYVDMESFPRREQFEHFRNMAFPCVGFTVNMDITKFRREIKERGWPFFHTLLYRTVWAANSVPEIRQRIRGDRIVQYDFCEASYTLALPDETYCYCHLRFDMPFEEFLPYAEKVKSRALEERSMDDGDDFEGYFFVSSVPWISFTSAIQPMDIPADGIPRFLFGKFFEQGDKILLPVCVLTHHALTDGWHLSKFYQRLQQLLDGEE